MATTTANKTTTTRTRTTTTAPKAPSTEEFFKQRAIELGAEIKRIDAGTAKAQETIETNTETRNARVMELLGINPMYYPAGSTTPVIGKTVKTQRDRTSVREMRIFTVVDGIRERGSASVGKAVFGVIFGFIVGLIIAFIAGWVVTTWLTVLIPILWLIWLALVMAGMAFGYNRATKPKDLVTPIK